MAVLLKDDRGSECRLKTVGGPVSHHAPKCAQRLLGLLVVIGKSVQELLGLVGCPVPADDLPFFGGESVTHGGIVPCQRL